MARAHTLLWAGGSVTGVFALAGLLALIGSSGATPPQPSRPASGECLNEAPQMRREHPKLLAQHRHAAVREGQRDPERSLQACVDCHSTPAEERGPEDEAMQFCNTCHEYAGVEHGCFKCHSDNSASAANQGGSHDQ